MAFFNRYCNLRVEMTLEMKRGNDAWNDAWKGCLTTKHGKDAWKNCVTMVRWQSAWQGSVTVARDKYEAIATCHRTVRSIRVFFRVKRYTPELLLIYWNICFRKIVNLFRKLFRMLTYPELDWPPKHDSLSKFSFLFFL